MENSLNFWNGGVKHLKNEKTNQNKKVYLYKMWGKRNHPRKRMEYGICWIILSKMQKEKDEGDFR